MASLPPAILRYRTAIRFAPAADHGVSSRIDYLDGWRAIAVGLVIAAHTLSVYGIKVLAVGTVGVYLFFGISGYIITRLLVLEQQKTGAIDLAAFYVRRLARIFPPLAIFLLAMVAIWPDRTIFGQAARAAAFTCNMGFDGGCIRLLEHTWSLAFEEQYYLIYPLLLAGVRRWWLLPLAVFWALPFLVPVPYIGHGGFARVVLIIVLGAAYAAFEAPLSEGLQRMPRALVAAMPMVLAGWALLDQTPGKTVLGAIVPLAAIITAFVLPTAFPFLRNLLRAKVLTRIGLYSYTLYLWQQFFSYPWPWNRGAMPILGIFAALAIAALSYHTVEKLCRDWGHRYSRSRRNRAEGRA